MPGSRHRLRAFLALAAFVGAGAGCSIPPPGDGTTAALFANFGDCGELTDWFRDALTPRVTAWGLSGGGHVAVGRPIEDRAVAVGAAPETAASTTTNVQEAGIDEGDVVDHDGRYVYSAVGASLRVLDTRTGRITTSVALPDGEHRLILYTGADTDALVVATLRWNATGSETVLSRFAVDAGTVTLAGQDHLEGAFVQMRGNGSRVQVVMRHDPTTRLAFVQPTSSDSEDDALDANRSVVDAVTADDLLPRRHAAQGPSSLRTALECAAVGTPNSYSGLSITWVATVDLAAVEEAPVGGAGVVADAEHIYATSDALYVATVAYPDVDRPLVPVRPTPASTLVHRFALEPAVRYQASGEVPGRIVSSYSMSEHDGRLRVATTTDAAGFGRDTMSGVRVLERRGGELVLVGTLDGLGVGEQIHGVRFAGDLAFVVTFRQIDPLYVIDLSDPTRPQRRGELKIPGFSTWLAPIGDGRLLAFGRSGTDDGALTGVQWSLFDVSDLDAPELLDTLAAGSDSEGVWDPHALAYEPASGLVLSPGNDWSTVTPAVVGAPAAAAPVSGAASTYVVIGQVDGQAFDDVTRIAVPTTSRRALLVDGQVVSVNGDGSFTVSAPRDGAPATQIP